MPPRVIDLTGKKFGKLLVERIAEGIRSGPHQSWYCVCDCGASLAVSGANLRSGRSLSCGCVARKKSSALTTARNLRHGMHYSPAWRSWSGILTRCLNDKSEAYQGYGARGITVCERWMSFENFYEDMGDRPPGTSIDRIDGHGNYEPGNCRWATPMQQRHNRVR